MVAVACLVLVLACLALAVGRARVRIRVDVEPTRVTVGDPATGRIEVTNASRRGLLPLLVELPVGDTAARFALPTLGAGRAHEELFVVPTRRRGVVPGRARRPRCTATRSGWCGAPWRGPSAPSCSSTRSPSRSRASAPGCCATSRAGDARPVDVRPRLPRPARVPARRRPPLHPLALLGQARPAARAAVPRHPALAPRGRRRHRPRGVRR